MGTEAPYLLLEKGPGRPEGLGELLQVGEGDGVRPWLSRPAEATSELPLHSRLSGGGLALAASGTRSPGNWAGTMTKSSVSQESLLLPPESRDPCRKPAASAGEVRVFCSCGISPRDGGDARWEAELLLELLPDPELGYEGTGTGGAARGKEMGQCAHCWISLQLWRHGCL